MENQWSFSTVGSAPGVIGYPACSLHPPVFERMPLIFGALVPQKNDPTAIRSKGGLDYWMDLSSRWGCTDLLSLDTDSAAGSGWATG